MLQNTASVRTVYLLAPILTAMYATWFCFFLKRQLWWGGKKGILPSIHAHIKVHLLVCKSQETFQAGVSCGCQGLPVPLQPDGLQPRTHRPLWHTHLRYDWHAHLWTHPRLQYGACRSVKTQRRWRQPGCWWQRTKLGVWNHNCRSGMHGRLIIKVKQWRCGCEYNMNTCALLYHACLPLHSCLH